MKKILLSLLVFQIFLQACVSSEEMAKIIKPTDIKELGYFTPFTYLGHIDKGNKIVFNEGLSDESESILMSLLNSNKEKYQIKDLLTPSDTLLQILINKEIIALASQAHGRQRVHKVGLTPLIDSVMEANHQRFALALIATGFSREKGNFGGQVAKGFAVGILTLGSYIPAPIKANSTIEGLIFDSKHNTVALYSRTSKEKEPTDPETLDKQMEFLLYNLLKSTRIKRPS